jgi:alpha-amylase
MAVMMQAFYWDAPIKEQKEGEWWNHLSEKAPELAAAGINAMWLPPICKGAEARSPGYDPYDYFDLGDFDQKGAKKTLYGNRKELENLIKTLHEHKIGAYADMVINHNSGADEKRSTRSMGRNAGRSSIRSQANFRGTGTAFIPRVMSA